MSATRWVAATATDVACRAMGRRSVIRVARYVMYRARLDGPNNPVINGEQALQRWTLEGIQEGEQIHVADVGANIGRWSRSMLAAAGTAGRGPDLRLHAFEPDPQAMAQLARELADTPARLNPVALSDRSGTSLLHVVEPAAGTNSLHAVPGTAMTTQSVHTHTLDSYAERSGITRFALVKIDTEGHDLAVLRGAAALLTRQDIAIVQFEYNHRWIYARSFLRDALELLHGSGYRTGKLTPRGVEFYPCWDPELETFVEGNYVACTPEVAQALPAVPWWKETAHATQTGPYIRSATGTSAPA